MRVLIADDNAVFRSTLRHLLEGVAGWVILEASDGREAISKAVENRPDVIILDLAMPVMDGLTSGREISKLLPETPIIMCTMHMSAQVEDEARKSGIRKVLSKSESSLLIDTIRQLVSITDAPAPQPPIQIPPPALDAIASAAPAVQSSPADTVSEPPAPSPPKNVA